MVNPPDILEAATSALPTVYLISLCIGSMLLTTRLMTTSMNKGTHPGVQELTMTDLWNLQAFALYANNDLQTWFRDGNALEHALHGEWFLLPIAKENAYSEPVLLVGSVPHMSIPGNSIIISSPEIVHGAS